MVRVEGHIDRLAVILHLQDAVSVGDPDVLDGMGRSLGAETNDLVMRIDHQLIHELDEAGIHRNGLGGECARRIAEPDSLRGGFDASNVGVGEGQNMLPVRVFAVLGCEVHGTDSGFPDSASVFARGLH